VLGHIVNGGEQWEVVWTTWQAVLEAHPAFTFTQLGADAR
jgi:hypothetical protein